MLAARDSRDPLRLCPQNIADLKYLPPLAKSSSGTQEFGIQPAYLGRAQWLQAHPSLSGRWIHPRYPNFNGLLKFEFRESDYARKKHDNLFRQRLCPEFNFQSQLSGHSTSLEGPWRPSKKGIRHTTEYLSLQPPQTAWL